MEDVEVQYILMVSDRPSPEGTCATCRDTLVEPEQIERMLLSIFQKCAQASSI